MSYKRLSKIYFSNYVIKKHLIIYLSHSDTDVHLIPSKKIIQQFVMRTTLYFY